MFRNNHAGAVLALAVLLATLRIAAGADLHFPQPAVDVGEVRCGAPLSHRFAFVNRGQGPLEIVEVRAGCGCLVPRLPQRVYQPGESGTLHLEINTLSQTEGPHTWTCQVAFQNAGQRHEVTLQIGARVITEVSVRPAVLTIFTDSAAGHELVLTDRRPQPLAIAELRASSSRVLPRLIEDRRDDQGHTVRRIRLDVAADCAEGRHEELLSIITTDALYRELKVPVTVVKRSRPRVAAAPAEVKLSAGDGQAIPAALLRLRDRQDERVIIERITADDPAITCQWAPGPDTQATLKVRIDRARMSNGSLTSTIRVQFSQPVRETLIIPVKCEIGR